MFEWLVCLSAGSDSSTSRSAEQSQRLSTSLTARQIHPPNVIAGGFNLFPRKSVKVISHINKVKHAALVGLLCL